MNHKRPVNLDLTSLKYPPMAIASILHRISGLVLFILLPLMLYFLSLSLSSVDSFMQLTALLTNAYLKFALWVFGVAWIYHMLAGVRHLLMDCGIGEEVHAGRLSANIVLCLALILSIFLGVWLW